MARKKKSTNKVVPILVLAAILGGGYYWLMNDSKGGFGLTLPGESSADSVSSSQPAMLPEDATDTVGFVADSVLQNQTEPSTHSADENRAAIERKSAGKNAYVDEYGNVIYTKPNGKDPITYKTYRQGRWGYGVKYPSFLTKESHAQSSDGGTFEDGKGRKLSTYASWNVFNESITDLYRKDFPGVKSVTYKKLFRREKCYVKSGYTNDNRIFYLKEAIYEKDDQEVVATLIFYYPKSFNKEADQVVKEIFTSFPIVQK